MPLLDEPRGRYGVHQNRISFQNTTERSMPEETISAEDYDSGVGGLVDRCSLTLRFFGDQLDPDCVTALLGVEPTDSQRKGDRKPRTLDTGRWILDCEETTDTVDNQIRLLLGDLTDNLRVWQQLGSDFSSSLMISLILRQWTRGTMLSAQTIQSLADRALKLQIEVYAPRSSQIV